MIDEGQAWPVLFGLGGLLVLASIAVSAILILLLRPLLLRYALARPNARSSHREPTAQGGGIAVVATTLLLSALAVWLFVPGVSDSLRGLAVLFGATLVLAVVGAVDDIRVLPVVPRLIVQAVAVAFVIVALPDGVRAVPALPPGLEQALLVVGGLWFVNLVNFMDGIDLMTVVETVTISVGVVIVGSMTGVSGQALVIALALIGAMLGFAPFNRPVARLFLGDVGSLPIGLLLGWLLVLIAGHGHLVAALLLPLYYLADATVTLFRRLFAGRAIWEAHRDHYYQHAVDRGLPVWTVVGRVAAVNGGLIVLAIVSVRPPFAHADLLMLLLGMGLVAWLLGSLTRTRR